MSDELSADFTVIVVYYGVTSRERGSRTLYACICTVDSLGLEFVWGSAH